MIDRTEAALSRVVAALALLGGFGLIAATLVTCISILLRFAGRVTATLLGYVPESLAWMRPILGEEELVSFGVGFALFAAMPWVMLNKGHIRIDLLQSLYGERINRILDVLAELSLAAMAWLIMTRQWFQIIRPARRSEESLLSEISDGHWNVLVERLRDSQESQILGVPLWPSYAVAEFCVAVFFVVAVFSVVRSLRDVFAPGTLH